MHKVNPFNPHQCSGINQALPDRQTHEKTSGPRIRALEVLTKLQFDDKAWNVIWLHCPFSDEFFVFLKNVENGKPERWKTLRQKNENYIPLPWAGTRPTCLGGARLVRLDRTTLRDASASADFRCHWSISFPTPWYGRSGEDGRSFVG